MVFQDKAKHIEYTNKQKALSDPMTGLQCPGKCISPNSTKRKIYLVHKNNS